MKKTNEQNVLEAVSLIAPEYVEAAVYPAAGAKKTLTARKNWWKPVMTAAAAVVIGVTCVSFAPRALAFAEQLFNATFEMDGSNSSIDGKMEKIHIKDDVTFAKEDEEMTFRDITDAEKYLGVTLMHSKRATQKSVPLVNMSVVHRGELITVSDDAYYLFREELDDEGNYHVQADGAYCISYEARFLTNRSTSDGYISTYADAEMTETYTTKNGLEAGIFVNAEIYHAVVYHDGVQYIFSFTPGRDNPDDRQESDLITFKEYLDTLK